ncbi:MAG: methionine ABC transporter permease [Parachlamydiaceae bacterium]|nr:methionine ABC transporter permease [Parachlamydiaceae bacterium]
MNPDTIKIIINILPFELWNTLYMVFCSAIIALFVGLPLGVILTITERGHLNEQPVVHRMISTFVNIGRSFPFAILMISLIPFTRWIVGTSIGTTASIVPLSLAAIPFVARIVEASLKEVDRGMIEAATVMGATTFQIIKKLLIPEALPSLVLGFTTTVINLIGYSAMAGTMGGGGLGKIAIQYGYQRFDVPLMVITVMLLIVVVQMIQWIGQSSARKIFLKRGRGLKK